MHLRDLGFGWRRLAKRPMFAVTAIATLALAIGANTAIFAVVHSVLLAPLPFPAPDRLVRVSGGSTIARFEAMRRAASFADVGAYLVTAGYAALPGSEGAESVRTAQVSANFLSVLAVRPVAGRGFLAEEEQAGVNVAMIGSRLWTKRFGSEPRVVGATIVLSGVPHTVVGVLPPGFRFPFDEVDVWRPLQPMAMPEQQRVNSPVLQLFGRLRDGVPFERAAAEVRAIQQAYALSHPGLLDARPDRVGTVVGLHDALVGDSRSVLWMLFGAAGLVAAIACANVAGLLLAQALARSREFAIRTAVGAARARLIGQLLWESAILAAGGAIVGVPLAIAGVRVIAGLDALALPRANEIAVDRIALAFAVALSGLTVLLFGLAPAIAASRTSAMEAMRRGDAGMGRLLSSPRGVLVSAQIALSVMLTAGTAMLALSLIRLHAVDPGFQTANILTMRVGLPKSGVNEFLDELVRRTESLPGVRSAAVTLTLPMTGFAGTPVHGIGPPAPPLNERPIAVLQIVTPGYFRTMGIAVQRGRDFTSEDRAGSAPVAVIDERLARRFWPAYPNEDPVGQSILAGASPQPLRVVGVVSPVRQAGLAEEPEPGIYRPRSQTPPVSAMFAVRTEGDPKAVVASLRRELAKLDPYQAIADVKSLAEVVRDSEGRRRSISILLGSFAATALVLAIIGLYGAIAQSVIRRERELGIRRALGAQGADVYRLVMSQGLQLTAVGLALGIAGSFGVARVLASLLYRVSQPPVLAGVGVLFLVVAVAAAFVPARRAARVDPASVLRLE